MTTQGKIKVLIAKVGLDGHDRGAKVIARALQEAGMEVTYTGIRQTPLMVVERAIAERADVVGLSSLSGAHLALFPQVIEGLHERGLEDVIILAGGIIPQEDGERLKALGVRAVFGPGSSLQSIVEAVQQAVQARRNL
jgi:methylmalonyl-CoA mutase C-terminal domain/subunit